MIGNICATHIWHFILTDYFEHILTICIKTTLPQLQLAMNISIELIRRGSCFVLQDSLFARKWLKIKAKY